jgi:hypothetical protein
MKTFCYSKHRCETEDQNEFHLVRKNDVKKWRLDNSHEKAQNMYLKTWCSAQVFDGFCLRYFNKMKFMSTYITSSRSYKSF